MKEINFLDVNCEKCGNRNTEGHLCDFWKKPMFKKINVAMEIDKVVRKIDSKAWGSDGLVNGEPAFRFDFETEDATHLIYVISKSKKNE